MKDKNKTKRGKKKKAYKEKRHCEVKFIVFSIVDTQYLCFDWVFVFYSLFLDMLFFYILIYNYTTYTVCVLCEFDVIPIYTQPK